MSEQGLLDRHPLGEPVAFGGAGAKTAGDLLRDAARVARALPEPSRGSHVLLVANADRYAMAAAWVGILARGHAVALPPNLRRESIFAVQSRPETVALLHDTDSGAGLRLADLLERADGGPPLAAPFVPGPGVIATVFTSGTTGPMLAAPKTAAQLYGEARALARTFGIGPGDRVVGSVPPVHIYGLLFTLLLPLVSGAAFARETPHHAESIAHCVAEGGATLLVTVPVQLRALAGLRAGSLAALRSVVSSAGPLPDPVARAFRERHGLAVREVFGSTETGGIAHRERCTEPPPAWRPFEGVCVTLAEGDRLAVDSPHLEAGLPRPFVTGDVVELLPDGGFRHLGRADGIVKIGGRRISIEAMEEGLRRRPDVADAAVIAVPAEAGRGHQLLAAVSPADCDLAAVRLALLERFEPSTLPRRLVAVPAIPREENGKLQRARVFRLFGLDEKGRPIARALDFGEVEVARGDGAIRVRAEIRLPAGWDAFEGHFEGHPVLAGALQIKELVLPVARRVFPDLGDVRALGRVKFTSRIVPEDALTISLERSDVSDGEARASERRLRFDIHRHGELCSSGQLEFDRAESA